MERGYERDVNNSVEDVVVESVESNNSELCLRLGGWRSVAAMPVVFFCPGLISRPHPGSSPPLQTSASPLVAPVLPLPVL